MQINHKSGGRGVYFDELNGHSIELLTVRTNDGNRLEASGRN